MYDILATTYFHALRVIELVLRYTRKYAYTSFQ